MENKLLLVALGGAVGSCLRYGVSLLSAGRLGTGFPYGTLFVNIIGCFIIGAFMAAATERFITNPNLRFLVVVGFCGGLTTFSSFSYETIKLLEEAGLQYALLNILANMVCGFVATWLGIVAVKAL